VEAREEKPPKEELPPKPAEEVPPKPNEQLPPEKPPEEPLPIPLLKTEGMVEAEEKSSALKALVSTGIPQEPTPTRPVPMQKGYLKPRVPKTPMEKKLYNKFGDDGLYAYSLIDEFKTPRDIVKQTGMSEERLREIIKFMREEGIIRLERPIIASPELIPHEEKPAPPKPVAPPSKPVTAAAPPQTKPPAPPPKPVNQVALPVTPPLQTRPPAPPPKPAPAPPQPKVVAAPPPAKPVATPPPMPVERPAPKVLKPLPFSKEEIYLPTAIPLKLVTKLRVEGELLRRYGNEGTKLFSLMNGSKVNVKIMKEMRISPARFEEIASFLLESGAIKVQRLTPENVRELYGDEGFLIYNKYGTDGILLYEFIDKKSSLKDIVKMSGIEPRLAVEIFTFIHKVLGLDIPLDTELLYKQLGIRP
jgi:DNA-binding Lrp family transcriptional regulator